MYTLQPQTSLQRSLVISESPQGVIHAVAGLSLTSGAPYDSCPLHLPCSDVLGCVHAHCPACCGDPGFKVSSASGFGEADLKKAWLRGRKNLPPGLGHTNPKVSELEAETHRALRG